MTKAIAILASLLVLAACGDEGVAPPDGPRPLDPQLVAEGKEIFRFDTFGDEAYWTDTLRMHEVVESSVSPELALQVGLKVDADALPAAVKEAIARGEVDLSDPATTLVLLELDAVLGLKGEVEERRLRPPAPGAGATDGGDRRRARGRAPAMRCGRHHRSEAPLHDDARRRETELHDDHERRPRHVRRGWRRTERVPPTCGRMKEGRVPVKKPGPGLLSHQRRLTRAVRTADPRTRALRTRWRG